MFGWLRTYLRGVSWPIIVAMIALMVISVLAVRVAEQADPSNPLLRNSTVRQTVYVGVGVLGFLVATIIPYRRIGRVAYVLFGVTLAVLCVLAAASIFNHSSFLIPEIRGSHRWISFGFVQIQPSEIAKLTFIIMLAWYLRYGDHYRRLRGLIVPFVLTFIPLGLILVEPDLGTSLLLLPTLYFMLFMAGAKLRHLLGIMAVGTALIFFPVPRKISAKMGHGEIASRRALAYWHGRIGGADYVVSAAPLAVMKPHQLSRIDGWLRQSDPLVEINRKGGFHLQQSMIILGSGGLRGQDVLKQKNFYFRMLPDDHTDFIYAVIGGQWGFMGCVGVLLIYVAIFLCGAEVAATTDDSFGRLLVIGVLGLLLAQIIINAGMTIGLMPITGMTLPMVSYGGSSMLVNCIALGLLINVAQRRPILLGRKPFEYGGKRTAEPATYGPLFEWGQNRRRRDEAD